MSLCDIARTKNLLQKYNFSMESKHYFLSANTNEGFCNYFDFATSRARDGYVYILKGGSGTGKSTLMKNVGKFFGGLGESIEFFHCSSLNFRISSTMSERYLKFSLFSSGTKHSGGKATHHQLSPLPVPSSTMSAS